MRSMIDPYLDVAGRETIQIMMRTTVRVIII